MQTITQSYYVYDSKQLKKIKPLNELLEEFPNYQLGDEIKEKVPVEVLDQ